MDTAHETSLDALRRDVQWLKDVEEIKRLKARYFRYVDLHWWPELRSLFTDDAVFEIGESSSAPRTTEEFVTSVGRHLGEAMSVHHGHMPEIEIVDAGTAHGIWSMFDVVEPSPSSGYPVLTGYGHYTEDYRKVDGQWRIARLRLTRLRRSVDGNVIDGAQVNGRRKFAEP
ncbi:nuclear transport factor 2 family protein [Streptomyces sp. NWU339]|uniref:nuclear transport factor 2 family protein n=1 Tax=Streptomyces sp. NWU339 TaxID=2185284 RepID=UPI000D67E138|nr:nuclear transport factor 2 family protein [Streptomyces sp. NWU339]PWI10449.1 nuclear transport factor 2 family protein [Streptomyces sp. NWU339]